MSFQGFTQNDFNTFQINDLDGRMEAIRDRIQPKFKEIGDILCDDITALAGNEMFVHIAKHARRTVNPPKDTWLAICDNKRGYKKHPHFQVGLFDDHVFLWLAYIYELPHKEEIAEKLLNNLTKVKQTIPSNYVISLDHMKKDAYSFGKLTDAELIKHLERFRDVKKAEFLVGRHIPSTDPILQDGEAFLALAKETFATLMPLYRLSFE
ncbi:YktB family protein [Halalkalibacterium ligniniphilum]|uniref:YktB family protein n=1 Tax=Halalkalibacterium ligniniphilum TaxID=1134413 RepID=UPI00034DD3C4|nr:DUF1054 domain-containing protein [Halalkalibacterium ligniniphilum]